MVIETTCMDCGQTFRYNRIRKPKEHYASKYLAKHRVDMLVKALRKVQAYCAGQKHGCRECAFWNTEEEECKLYGSCPVAWDLDDDDATADTSEKGV